MRRPGEQTGKRIRTIEQSLLQRYSAQPALN
jgi:hypothetical protein